MGRPRGALNKKTQDLFDLCLKERVNPFQALLKLCKHEDVNIRLPAISQACKYLYPIRKAVEVTGQDGGPVQTEAESSFKQETIERFMELVKVKYAAK